MIKFKLIDTTTSTTTTIELPNTSNKTILQTLKSIGHISKDAKENMFEFIELEDAEGLEISIYNKNDPLQSAPSYILQDLTYCELN